MRYKTYNIPHPDTLDEAYCRSLDAQRIGLEYHYCHDCNLEHVRPEGTIGEVNYCCQCGSDQAFWSHEHLEEAWGNVVVE